MADRANAVGRLAGRMLSRSRWLRAGMGALRATLGSLWRVVHSLLLQLAGLFFGIFALTFALRIPRVLRQHQPQHTAVLVALTVTFGWFGVTSFWRARAK
jgi:hypothetical protein